MKTQEYSFMWKLFGSSVPAGVVVKQAAKWVQWEHMISTGKKPQQTTTSVYTFGPYVLDPETVRLSKQGQVIDLEPQVFNTLLLLIEQRHRVVSKSELLQQIWQGRVVTDQVVTRIIYQLRKVLDDPGQTSHIRTVRGAGYQFITSVTQQPASIKQRTDVTATDQQSSSRLWQLLLVLLVGLLVWFALVRESGPVSSQHNKAAQHKIYPVVSVLPVAVEAGNEELSILVQSFVDYLTSQLALNLNIKVIHPDSLLGYDEQQGDMWAIQQATQSDYIIEGFLKSVSSEWVEVHLTLHKKSAQETLVPFVLGSFKLPYPHTVEDLHDLYKQSKLTVRNVVKIIRPGLTIDDRGKTETDDPEAYRLAITAHHMSRTDDCQDMQRAEQLLRKAVARDDEFVYAYLELFSNYYKRVWICGESTALHAKGLAVAEMIDRLAPHVYQTVAIRRSTLLVESNQTEQAFEYSKNANWNDPQAIYDQSYSLRYAGFLNVTSRNLARILQLDPLFFGVKPIEQAPNTLLYQNRFAEHLALLAEPGSSYHDYFRGLNLFLTEQPHDAADVLRGVTAGTGLFEQFSQALLLIIEGEAQAAVQVIDGLVALRAEMQHTDGEMSYKVAQLYTMAGHLDQGLKHLQIAVDQGFFPMNYFLIDPALKAIRADQRFAQIIEQATRRHEAFAARFGLIPETGAVPITTP